MFKMTRDEEVTLIQIGLKTLLNDAMSPKPTIKKIKKVVAKPKGRMTKAGRDKIRKAMKKRWAAVKKNGGNSLG